MKENKHDISSYLNEIIKSHKKGKTINTKNISDGHHTFGELYNRELVLFRLVTSAYPKLSFKSLKHYDEENDPIFNGDFMVGIYTPKGPITYHFKLEYLDSFKHISYIPKGPKYDNYTEDEKNERINYLSDMIISGKTEDDILIEILSNKELDKSYKPIQYTK